MLKLPFPLEMPFDENDNSKVHVVFVINIQSMYCCKIEVESVFPCKALETIMYKNKKSLFFLCPKFSLINLNAKFQTYSSIGYKDRDISLIKCYVRNRRCHKQSNL